MPIFGLGIAIFAPHRSDPQQGATHEMPPVQRADDAGTVLGFLPGLSRVEMRELRSDPGSHDFGQSTTQPNEARIRTRDRPDGVIAASARCTEPACRRPALYPASELRTIPKGGRARQSAFPPTFTL